MDRPPPVEAGRGGPRSGVNPYAGARMRPGLPRASAAALAAALPTASRRGVRVPCR